MKKRTYNYGEKGFCPNCHKEVKCPFNIDPDKFSGSINLNCSNCEQGTVSMKGKAPGLKEVCKS